MRLSFRQRLFVGLLALGTLPLAAALVVLALQVRSEDPSTGARAAIDDIAESGRQLLAVIDTTQLSADANAALEAHTETLATGTAMARRAEVLSRIAAGAAGVIALSIAVAVVAVSVTLARRWSGSVSAPIEELRQWVRRIEQRQSLPRHVEVRGAPEFDTLRNALRDMSAALERLRQQEMEQERLHAFRETARQVAHEMRGPLTSARLAIGQLSKPDVTLGEQQKIALEVLQDETLRLESLAQEFSDFGRLPEGPEAPIDISELVEEAVSASVPDDCPVTREVESGLIINGHYEPLRRAMQNLIRNAVEVSRSAGIAVRVYRLQEKAKCSVCVEIEDHGPGVSHELREKIFQPYFTTKELGTGLGLAIVRQTVDAHGGAIAVTDADGGGARFTIRFSERGWQAES